MTEPTDAPEAHADPDAAEVEVPEPDSAATTEPGVPEGDDGPLGRQAAKFRKRVRELEGEREQLTATVAAVQRRHIESLLGPDIGAEAFWRLTDLADVLNADGIPDPTLVAAAVADIKKSLGLNRGVHAPTEGKIPTAPTPSGRQQWDAAFTPGQR